MGEECDGQVKDGRTNGNEKKGDAKDRKETWKRDDICMNRDYGVVVV